LHKIKSFVIIITSHAVVVMVVTVYCIVHRKCYLQCGTQWHITRYDYEAIFSLANQLPVS